MSDTKETKISIESLDPFFEWIVARRDHATEETETGLIIPEAYQDKPLICTVLKTGWDAERYCKPNDIVLIQRYEGSDMKLNDGSWVTLIRPSDIMAGLKPDG